MRTTLNGPVMAGDPMVLMTRSDRRLAATSIARHRVTRWRSIATMAIDLSSVPEAARIDPSSQRMIGGGGGSMPASAAGRLRVLTGPDDIEGYGMSGTMAASHINPADAPGASGWSCRSSRWMGGSSIRPTERSSLTARRAGS